MILFITEFSWERLQCMHSAVKLQISWCILIIKLNELVRGGQFNSSIYYGVYLEGSFVHSAVKYKLVSVF